ncbi:MAG: hypothetical protein KGY78_09695, partial [Anaerolineae bacterium]|nr:hypothetical protein [Anaerolineae bacterium]
KNSVLEYPIGGSRPCPGSGTRLGAADSGGRQPLGEGTSYLQSRQHPGPAVRRSRSWATGRVCPVVTS